MSLGARETLKEIIKELLENKIIRESNSPYASPVLLVQRKNGKPRLCIDYRKLNSKIQQVRYPLPRMDDQLDFLQGHKYFTSLDLTSGYYQIPIEENSKYITSFTTPDGQYEFERMPFGISTAPAKFQSMINTILGSLRGTISIAYMDDILVPSKSVEQGFERLELILEVLLKHHLTLNIEKCKFFESKVTFLGFEVNEEGVRPGNEKTKAVAEFPTPKNMHNVRQFLGLTGFFRQFVKNYALIATPLHKLTRKAEEWH